MSIPMLHGQDADLIRRLEDFNKRMNQEPDKDILQPTPDGKAQYIPVDFIENMLREDFAGVYQITLQTERRELNEYIVVARISVYHPIVQQWMHYDGLGVTQIMQDSGATLAQFNDTKKKNALEMNAPKAYSEAIKNAAKKIGKRYGGGLNRKHTDKYEPVYSNQLDVNEAEAELDKCKTQEEVKALTGKYPDLFSNKDFKKKATVKYNSLKV